MDNFGHPETPLSEFTEYRILIDLFRDDTLTF